MLYLGATFIHLASLLAIRFRYDHGVVQCTLRVRDDKKTLLFYLQPENRLLMIGHERRKMGGVNVMVSVVSQSKRHDPTYIGKVRH